MSEPLHHAVVYWVPTEAGGRRTLPQPGLYSTVARFEDEETWPHEAWSVVLDIDRFYRGGRYAHGSIQFLSENAPQHLLHGGSRFELLEGKRRVAKGVVLERAVPMPDEVNDLAAALLS
jgi:hypothetical protein